MHESESATTIIKELWQRVAKLHKEKYGFVEPIFHLSYPQLINKTEQTILLLEDLTYNMAGEAIRRNIPVKQFLDFMEERIVRLERNFKTKEDITFKHGEELIGDVK